MIAGLVFNVFSRDCLATSWFISIFHLQSEAVARTCSVKNLFLKISQNSQENTCAKASFLMKSQARACSKTSFLIKSQICNFIKKEAPAQVFSCEFCEISKNIFSYRTVQVAAPEECWWIHVKGALSGLRQFLAIESPLKIMKSASCFTSKALFILKVLKFLSWLFDHVAKRLD